MTKGVQFRRGTTAQHDLFSGAEGEITVDTDKKIAVVQDGAKLGGYPLVGTGVTQTLSNKQFSGVTTFTNSDNTSTVSIGIGTTNGTALKITHTGSGNAFVVEDTSSDLTPFVIDATGNVGIGTTVATYELTVLGTGVTAPTGSLSGVLGEFVGYQTAYAQINLRNTEGISTTASSDLVITSDIGTDTTNFIDLGINNGSFSPNASSDGWSINGALDGYLYSQTGGLAIGVAAAGGKRLSLFAGGLTASNERVAITTIGVGVGTTSPLATFQVGSAPAVPQVGFGSFAIIDNLGRIGLGTTNLASSGNRVQIGAADTTGIVVVDPNGSVGIGTTRAMAKIHSNVSQFTSGGIAGIFSGSTTASVVEILNHNNTPGTALRVGVGSTTLSTLVVSTNGALNTKDVVGVGSVGFGTNIATSLVDIYGSVNVSDGFGGPGIVTTNQLRIKQGAIPGGLTAAVGLGSTGTIQHSFDGLLVFSSGISTVGKLLIPTQSFHRITPDRVTIAAGAAASTYFNASTSTPLTPSGLYEIEYNLYYSRQFAGVTTFRITNTAANAAVVSLDATSTSGISTIGQLGIVQAVAHAPTTMSATNPGLGFSFSNGTSNFAKIRVFVQNTNSTTNIRLDVQNSNSTLTPLANSTWKCTYLGDVSSSGVGVLGA